MGWLGSSSQIYVTKRKNKAQTATVTVSGTVYKLFQSETVTTSEYRGLTYSAANTMVDSATHNYDSYTYTDWTTGIITHANAKIDGSKSNAAFSRKFESGGYTVIVTLTAMVSSTA